MEIFAFTRPNRVSMTSRTLRATMQHADGAYVLVDIRPMIPCSAPMISKRWRCSGAAFDRRQDTASGTLMVRALARYY